MLFLDPVPARMRDYAFPSDSVLQGDGRNLSAVLYRLWGADREKAIEQQRGGQEPFESQRRAILSFIQSLPEQDITSLSFLEEPRGGVLADLSIIKEWERNCALHPMSRVRIWSLDSDLASYDRQPWIENRQDEAAFEALLADEKLQGDFYGCLSAFAKTLAIAMSGEQFIEQTPAQRIMISWPGKSHDR